MRSAHLVAVVAVSAAAILPLLARAGFRKTRAELKVIALFVGCALGTLTAEGIFAAASFQDFDDAAFVGVTLGGLPLEISLHYLACSVVAALFFQDGASGLRGLPAAPDRPRLRHLPAAAFVALALGSVAVAVARPGATLVASLLGAGCGIFALLAVTIGDMAWRWRAPIARAALAFATYQVIADVIVVVVGDGFTRRNEHIGHTPIVVFVVVDVLVAFAYATMAAYLNTVSDRTRIYPFAYHRARLASKRGEPAG